MNMSKDLACVKTVKVEREDLNSTIWKQGILFYWDPNTTRSESYIGLYPGGTIRSDIDSLEQFGAHSTWQIIITAPNTAAESVLHHEVLHSLGIRHEHARPDRDRYLEFEKKPLDSDHVRMDSKDWIKTKYPFEMQSVMIYTNSEKFTKKNGEPVTTTSPRLTTTDALQVQELYCDEKPSFEFKEHVMCSKKDELGFFRPVFIDRICDGILDCHDGSDEDESRFECSKTLGCCDGYRLVDETDGFRNILTEYQIVGQLGKRPYYHGFNRITKRTESLFCVEKEKGFCRWYIGGPENPNLVPDWMFGLNYNFSAKKCPPSGYRWSDLFIGRQVSLECFHQTRSVNYCDESSCDINAHCINLLNNYKCECNYGYTGDGKFCSPFIEIDECATKGDDCSENANCVDQRFGYTCVCKQGFIDRNSANPGRACESLEPQNGCCEKFQMLFSQANVTKHELIFTCSIKEYSSFRFSPMRQSYVCDIEQSTMEKYPNIGMPSLNLKVAAFTRLFIEHNGQEWVMVDRDENMNLIRKYNLGLSTETISNDLCLPTDISVDQKPPSDEEITYLKCLLASDPK